MQLDLSLELLNHFVLYNFGLNNFLKCHYEASFTMSCEIHFSKFALAQLLVDFKPIDDILFGLLYSSFFVGPDLVQGLEITGFLRLFFGISHALIRRLEICVLMV